MASETSETSEQIVCVRVACRDGRERLWQAIELLRQEQRQRHQPEAKTADTGSCTSIVRVIQ